MEYNFDKMYSLFFVRTKTFNDEAFPLTNMEINTAFIDPLGREHNMIHFVADGYPVFPSNAFPSGIAYAIPLTTNSTGETVYDNWDRVTAKYKPFSYQALAGPDAVVRPRLNTIEYDPFNIGQN